jgi:dihydroorotase
MQIEKNSDGKTIKLTILKPFDGHQHLRQGAMLELVAPMVRKRFAGAIVMPNTMPPITNAIKISHYDHDIHRAMYPQLSLGKRESFPVTTLFKCAMTLYFTDTLDPREMEFAQKIGCVGVKYYPRGLTTNSDSGIKDPSALWQKGTNSHAVLKKLAELGMVLLVHAADGFDKNGKELDPYDQEKYFVEHTLSRIIEAHPDLKIAVEHLSTKSGVEFMLQNGSEKLGCSFTLHHLTKDRRDVFRSGFHPHLMWWPIIQPVEHKEALQELAVADKPFVWLGSDSAPHPVGKKEAACCIGGVLTAHIGIEGYAEAFEDLHALDDRFERFASINGPNFYRLEPSAETITLVHEEWEVKEAFYAVDVAKESGGPDKVIPFRLGEKVQWKLAS